MNNLENKLAQHGIRPTAMRLLILKYLETQSAATDLSELEGAFDHADRVTIYRTLKTFEGKGLIHKIVEDNEEAKYALCFENCYEHHHHDLHAHFKCKSCHEIFCLHNPVNLTAIPSGFSVDNVNMVAYGICPRCRH